MTAFPGFCILAVVRGAPWGAGRRAGPARERLPAASGSASRPEAQGRCVPRCTRRQWHCPRDCRIMSVTLFHSQTSYCAEAGRAAFCGTPAAHLPNGNRFGGGVAVRQQGGDESRGGMRETAGKERATTIAARSWRRSPRISSPLSFLRRLPTSPLSKPHLLQATGDHGNG